MASIFYLLEKGQPQTSVTVANAAGSATVEVEVDLGDTPSRVDVVNALEHIKNVILRSDWPPDVP